MSDIVSSRSRILPGTSVQFRIAFEPSLAIRHCDVCTARCEGPRLTTFVNDEPQSEVCLDCARDITAIAKSLPALLDPLKLARFARPA